jgi:hypothetical protein
MNLQKAATYFADTPVKGLSGDTWVDLPGKVTLLPFDRFISEREFGNKRRYALVDVDADDLAAYSVIKLTDANLIYLVGTVNYDLHESAYSSVYLLHRAAFMGEMYTFEKTVKASGMAGSVVRASAGTWNCDVERVTFSNSKEFDSIRFSEVTLTLPSDCPADTDNEVKIGDDYFDIRESYMSSGFRYCRALQKRSV